MKRARIFRTASQIVLGVVLTFAASHAATPLLAQVKTAPPAPATWSADLSEIRRVAVSKPGVLPVRINMLKFAESHRTKNFAVKGAPAEPSIQARTVFQVVYKNGTTMIDSGMDQQIHKFFGRGTEEPYDQAAFDLVQKALLSANTIVMTHEHGDHVAGVIRSSNAAQLIPKTVLTRTQLQSLIDHPQMPEIKPTPEMAARFMVIEYDKYYSFAPGIALIKAPGHTPGSQMIYVKLASGAEYLFVGDTAWHMDGIRQMKGKDADWVKEDEPSVMAQLVWLNGLLRAEPKLHIVVSHDDEQQKQYVQQGILGGHLE
jgi:glyoxylase-like metal-dependent hydrolase (beta-lactamase superfamily II)